MVQNNFMMLRQQRLRDQPTSALGMAGMAKRWPGAQSQLPPPQTNTNPMMTPTVSSAGRGPAQLPGRPTASGTPTMMPPPNSPAVQVRQMPNPGTPWQSGGSQSANTLGAANGGRYYQDGTTWYSSGR